MSILYDWSDDFASNDTTVDSQHKYLFQIINDFAGKSVEDVAEEDIILFLDRLHEYCDFHFKEEEQLMIDNNYPLIEHHAKLHKELTQTVKRTREQLKNREICVQYDAIINFCLQWLNNHIAQEDLIFVNFAKNRHCPLGRDFVNRACEITTTNNRFLGVGKIQSLTDTYVVIENKADVKTALHFNDLVKVLSISPKTNKTQTFIAVVFYSHGGIIKLFNPTIIQTENKRQYFRVPMNNIEATIHYSEQKIPAYIQDVSEVGLQITANTDLNADDIVKIDFVLQNCDFSATYKVIRVIKKKQNQTLYGLKLEEMDDLLYKKLAMFVFNKQCLLRKTVK